MKSIQEEFDEITLLYQQSMAQAVRELEENMKIIEHAYVTKMEKLVKENEQKKINDLDLELEQI